MAGYPKIWVTKLYSNEWFLGLSNAQRGLWLQLICLAKLGGDSGRIAARGFASLAQQCGMDRATLQKTLRKFESDGRIELLSNPEGTLIVRIPSYQYYQSLRAKNEFAQLLKIRYGNDENSAQSRHQTAQSEPDRKKTELNRPEQSTIGDRGSAEKQSILPSPGEKPPDFSDKPQSNPPEHNEQRRSTDSGGSSVQNKDQPIRKEYSKRWMDSAAKAAFFAARAVQSKFGPIEPQEVRSLLIGSDSISGFGSPQRLFYAVDKIKPPVANPVAILWDFLKNPTKYLTDDEYDRWKRMNR